MTTIAEYQARRAAWIAWLRDPSHKQAKGVLFDGVGFCCLGGACDIMPNSNWRIDDSTSDRNFVNDANTYEDVFKATEGEMVYADNVLGDTAKEYYGIKGSEGEMVYADHEFWNNPAIPKVFTEYNKNHGNNITRLSTYNDFSGATFEEIATLIELNPPGLWEKGTY